MRRAETTFTDYTTFLLDLLDLARRKCEELQLDTAIQVHNLSFGPDGGGGIAVLSVDNETCMEALQREFPSVMITANNRPIVTSDAPEKILDEEPAGV